jgi:diguanylate cyclase (GGDEF)-like protein
VIDLTVRHLERVVGFTTCVVYLRDEKDDSIVARFVFGGDADAISNLKLAPGHGIAGWVVINDRPMINVDPALDLGRSKTGAGYRTGAVYPLAGPDRTLGALAVYAADRDEYSKEQCQLLESFARLCSTALQHAIHYEQTRVTGQTDQLTGLPNGRALRDYLAAQMETADKHGTQLTVLAFAVSGLDRINEDSGYDCGDRTLAEVARSIRSTVGEESFVGRIAGAKFAAVMSGYSRSFATDIGERAQSNAGSLTIQLLPGQVARVRLDYGVVEHQRSGQTVQDLLREATSALKAKKTKRTHDARWDARQSGIEAPYSN